jgi:hypothetical protein
MKYGSSSPHSVLCLKINTGKAFHVVASHAFGLRIQLQLFEHGISFQGCNFGRKLNVAVHDEIVR